MTRRTSRRWLIAQAALLLAFHLDATRAWSQVERQHDNTARTIVTVGGYRIETSLRIQGSDAAEIPHPYVNPDGSLHHHCIDPCWFDYQLTFRPLLPPAEGTFPLLLAGWPRNRVDPTAPLELPYNSYTWDLGGLYAEDNAEFSYDMPWSGGGTARSHTSEFTSFTFGLTLMGNGFNFGTAWTPNIARPFDMFWSGDELLPRFTLQYQDWATMAGGNISIRGRVKVKDPSSPAFGRVLGLGEAARVDFDFARDPAGGTKYIHEIIAAPVYDVVHTPEPRALGMLAVGLLAIGAAGWRRRGRAARLQNPPEVARHVH